MYQHLKPMRPQIGPFQFPLWMIQLVGLTLLGSYLKDATMYRMYHLHKKRTGDKSFLVIESLGGSHLDSGPNASIILSSR